jgi:hypothetical protein
MNGEVSIVNANTEATKPMSQAAIGRVLGLAGPTMTKYKLRGMPMDSVVSAAAWYKAHTNIAKRKRGPGAATLAAMATVIVKPLPADVVLGGASLDIAGAAPDIAAQPLREPTFARVGGDEFHAMIRAHEVRADGYGLSEDFDTARTREKIATANLAEIEEAALRDIYLVKADFERYLFNAGRMLRDTLTNCARRIGAEVAGLPTAEECELVIEREHRAAMASFSQQLRHTIKLEIETNPLNAPMVATP